MKETWLRSAQGVRGSN